MAYLGKYNKNPTQDDILREFRKFGSGVSMSTTSIAVNQPPVVPINEMVHCGMWLIRHLPVSRDPIFDYYSGIYQRFVADYLGQLDGKPNIYSDEGYKLLEDIHSGFVVFLETAGDIWAPILSQWTLQLLGQISSTNRNSGAFPRNASVNDVIQIWMGSKAIQSLLDLTSRCLNCIDHASTDAFISALLDTSASHTPEFDWVVAHVGNTYPQTIVTQILELGLQNFSSTPPQVSKMSSVVGILGHLVTTHSNEVQRAFDKMLQSGLGDSSNTTAEKFTIPYLLQLCSSSVPLLDVLMDSALPKITDETVQKLTTLIPQWTTLHFGGHNAAIIALVIHLILKSTRGPQALQILMNGCKNWRNIPSAPRSLLDHFTAELSSLLYQSESTHQELIKNFPCIQSLKDNSDIIISFLTDSDEQVCHVSKQFVKLLTLCECPGIGIKAVCHYLAASKSDQHLWHLTDLLTTLEMKHPNLLGEVCKILAVNYKSQNENRDPVFATSRASNALSTDHSNNNSKNSSSDVQQTQTMRQWKNLLRLIRTQSYKTTSSFMSMRLKITSVLHDNLAILTSFLDVRKMTFSLDEASLVIDILCRIPDITKNVRFGVLLTIERFLVDYLFKILSVTKNPKLDKIRDVSHISKLLYELSREQAVQNDALRSLVQSCLNTECRKLFQSKVLITKMNSNWNANTTDDEILATKPSLMYVSLLKENQKRTASISLTGIHSNSFHAGTFSKNGIRNGYTSMTSKVQINENPDANINLKLFLSVLLNVCMASSTANGNNGAKSTDRNVKDKQNCTVSVEAMRKVSLLLVEIVSPDVMFNGLPWPEEEFSKLQIERDLQIKRAFEEHPYLWDLLELVAHYCPSLCFCSVLLRALMATIMSHWTSCQEYPAIRSHAQLQWTIRLINVMKTGQLLPPPLCYIGEIIHELKANEVLSLLKDIWAYMKINIPVPTAFVKDSSTKKFIRNSDFGKVDVIFTEKLRLSILNNADRLGHFYPKLFPLQNQKLAKAGKEQK